ncbi:MAG: (d)CMP kinase [Nitrospirae bacterium]|nr:(d)CMP kinase [Nitrospirota bacterium]
MIIAIDGPVAAGKTTLSKLLADRLDFSLLDTGAIYRAVALASRQQGIDWSDESAVAAVAGRLEIAFRWINGTNHVLLAGDDATSAIRTPEMSQGASLVSALPEVRAALLDLQRQLGEQGNVIAEGRDIGTVVFPAADLKIFLTARPEVRARRRHEEWLRNGIDDSYEEVLEALKERDSRDENRPVAPLEPAADSMLLNSSELSIQQVLALALELVGSARGGDISG